MSFMYGIMSIYVIKRVKNNTLGLEPDGSISKFPSKQYFFVKTVQIIGKNLFMLIMRTFIDSFICNWEG